MSRETHARFLKRQAEKRNAVVSDKPLCPISSGRCPYPVSQCRLACVDAWDGDDGYDRIGDMWVWTGRESQRPDQPAG